MKSGSPNQPQGGLSYIRVADSGNNRSVVRFDQSAIAATVGAGTLTAAFLELEIVDNANNWSAAGRAVDVCALTNASWTEAAATWSCAVMTSPGSSTCVHAWAMGAAGPNPWAAPTDTQLIADFQTGAVSWDVTADVLAFLSGTPNAGWIVIKSQENQSGRADFGSRSSASPPRLVLVVAPAGEDAGAPSGAPTNPVVANADSYIRQGSRNTSSGGSTIARIQSSGRNRALVSFAPSDIAAVVNGGTVTSATLRWPILRNAENWSVAGRTIGLHRLTRSWVERNVTWECRSDSAPLDNNTDCLTESWEMDPPPAGPNPFVATPTATALITNATTGNLELDVTADVQAFVAGTTSNFGWILRKSDEGQAGKLELGTREGGSPPVLVLEVSGADGGPEDSGPMDTGPEDAGPEDAGPEDTGTTDTGPEDTGPEDAGPMDAGPPDTGAEDTGPTDAGPPAEDCDNSFDEDDDGLLDCADPDCATDPVCNTVPVLVAPPLPQTVVTNVFAATSFLYTGADPVQTGVAPGTITIERAAVIRGRVLDRNLDPIAGVHVEVLNRAEYGETRTRADGRFDMAVNGGDRLTFVMHRGGYIDVHRSVQAPWRDFVTLDDVVMTALDPNANPVLLGAAATATQVARGSVETDSDGTRQATMLFEPGTEATMRFGDDSTAPLSSMTLRLTEATVGETGPRAMPAELPPQSQYTYAIEIAADEARAAGAVSVELDRTAAFYLEEFLGFPPGATAPIGFYDPEQGVWKADENGIVLQVVGDSGGVAEIDYTGDGMADDPAALGATIDELTEVASLYPIGATLVRLPMNHMTVGDWNCPGIPASTVLPDNRADRREPVIGCNLPGSIIELDNQVLGEDVPVTGSPWSVHYRSNRTRGHAESRTIVIEPNQSPPPETLLVRFDIQIAGQRHVREFPPSFTGTTFTWDGLDVYGRPWQGTAPAHIDAQNEYPMVYSDVSQFGDFGNTALTYNSARANFQYHQYFAVDLGTWDSSRTGLGGLSVTPHHVYDPESRSLYLGDGTRQDAEGISELRTVAGNGLGGAFNDGPALTTPISFPRDVEIGPDGSIYFIADLQLFSVVRRVRDGTIVTVAGTVAPFVGPNEGDGGLATNARLANPTTVAFLPDGSMLIADQGHGRIRRLREDGIIEAYAGTGFAPGDCTAEGVHRTAAHFGSMVDMEVGPDGSVFVADSACRHVRRIDPSGMVWTVFRGATGSPTGDGGRARDASGFVNAIAVDRDNVVYIADRPNSRVRRVDTNGVVTTYVQPFAWDDPSPTPPSSLLREGWEGHRLSAWTSPQDMEIGPDGSLYLDNGAGCGAGFDTIQRVFPDGQVVLVVGYGPNGFTCAGFGGDGGPARAGTVSIPLGIGVGPDGALYIADTQNLRIRRVAPGLPSVSSDELLIPSRDGSEVYVFAGDGRHLETRDALTGSLQLSFAYDTEGRLSAISDADANTTTFSRDVLGNPTSIVGPYGHTTLLTVDSNAFVTTIADPLGNTHQLVYPDASGLISAFIDARGGVHSRSFDALGRLTVDQDPAGGSTTLAFSGTPSDFGVTATSAEGRTQSVGIENPDDQRQVHTHTRPDGLQSTQTRTADGARVRTSPTGTERSVALGGDPRFGTNVPFVQSRREEQPSGLTTTTTATRAVTVSNVLDPLSLATMDETVTLNGRPYTRHYDQSTGTMTLTSPEGRVATAVLDSRGRLTSAQPGNLAPTAVVYDARGRVSTVTSGTGPTARTTTTTYGADGFVETSTDSLGRVQQYERDAAGRVIRHVMPDLRQVLYSHDEAGNVTSVTPPSRPAHSFAYTPVDLVESYTPPDLGPGDELTQYQYDLDRNVVHVDLPDGRMVDYDRDTAGRLLTTLWSRGTQTNAYHPTTGQLSSITAPDGSTLAFTYDGDLPLSTTWAGAVSGSVSRTYDADQRIASRSVNGGSTVAFSYDDDSLLVGVGAMSLTRDPTNGLLAAVTLDQVATTMGYNDFAEPISEVSTYSGSTTLLGVSYVRDAGGRISSRTETIGGITTTYDYVYDGFGRLDQVRQDSILVADYAYDDNGNRLSVTRPGGTVSGTYDAQDRLLTYGDNTYVHNANGDLVSRTNTATSETTTFLYDEMGALLHATLPDGRVVDYLIDGRNRRIGKRIDGVIERAWLYDDQLRPAAELDGAGNVVSVFVYGEGGAGGAPDYMVRGGVVYRVLKDHVGSPRLVVNAATGAIAQRMDFDEFGRVVADSNPGWQPFGFAGGLWDRNTGLVRFGARDYDAETGRWTTKDPIGFEGGDANLYGYVLQDPINYIDASGLQDAGGPGREYPVSVPGPLAPRGQRILSVCELAIVGVALAVGACVAGYSYAPSELLVAGCIVFIVAAIANAVYACEGARQDLRVGADATCGETATPVLNSTVQPATRW